MTERIAKEDIVRVNENGQHVVVVAKGQPIPEGVEEPRAKRVDVPVDHKARRVR